MDKFLQQFKENLENQLPPSFDRQDWEDMQQRLHGSKSDPRSAWPYWTGLVTLFFLFSLAFNGFMYKQLEKISEEVTTLQQRRDTVFQTTIVYQTDTIYQSHSIQRGENPLTSASFHTVPLASTKSKRYTKNTNPALYQSSIWKNKSTLLTPWHSSDLWSQFSKQNVSANFFRFSFPINSYTTSPTQENFTGAIHSRPGQVSPIAPLPFSNVTSTENVAPNLSTPEIAKQKKSLRQVLYPFRPKGIMVGANIGGGTALSSNYNDLYVFNRGLVGKINFSEALRLSLDLSRSAFGYESGEMGNTYGVPVIPFPGDNLELEEIKVNRVLWSATIGIEYSFLTSKKWQPFLGFGFGTSTLTTNAVDYVFEDEMTDEYFIESRNHENGSNLSYTRFDGGIIYPIGPKWHLQLTVDYLYRLQNFGNQLPNTFDIGLSGLYHF